MAKTKEDYKKLLEKLKEKKSNSKFDFMTMADGPNVVRVLPGHPNMEGFFVEIYQHQKGTGKTYMSIICLNHGEPRATDCLIEDELEELRTSKDSEDKKLYNSYRAKARYYLNVIDRGAGNVVKTVECGQQILKGILDYVTDEEYGDILDPVEGTDLIITKTGSGMDTEYTVKPKRKPTPIFEDDDEITALLGQDESDSKLPDLSELKHAFEGEGDKALFIWTNGWAAFKELEEGENAKTGKTAAKATTKTAPAKGKPAAAAEEEDEDEEEDEAPVTPLASRCSVCGEKRFKKADGTISCPNGHAGVTKLADGAKPSKPSPTYLKEFPPPKAAVKPAETVIPLKTRCSICGEKRFKTSAGINCPNDHAGVPALAEGARPSKPSKLYLKEFPAPVEDEEEEEEEAPPKKAAVKSTSKPKTVVDEEEGLDDLDAILAAHSTKKK